MAIFNAGAIDNDVSSVDSSFDQHSLHRYLPLPICGCGEWIDQMLRSILSALFIAALIGCAATRDQKESYEQVKVGMTVQQLERVLGPIEWRYLNYELVDGVRNGYLLQFEHDRLEFIAQMVKGRAETPETSRVERGMTRAAVVAILGSPTTDCAIFPFDDARNWTNAGYEFCITNGRVSSKNIKEIPRPPHLAPRDCSPTLYFGVGSAALTNAAQAALRTFARDCGRPEDLKDKIVVVTGHTDASGDASANQSLSHARADTVRKFLVSQGVSAQSVRVAAAGASTPAVTGPNAAHSAEPIADMHRRVSLTVRPR